jgi:hypothetical protein
MANIIPHVRNGSSQVLHPLKQGWHFQTQVRRFISGHEQRCAGSWPRVAISLEYSKLPVSDRDALKAFFDTALGRIGSDIQITIGGDTYNNLTAGSDSFASSEDDLPSAYSTKFDLITTKSISPTQLDPSGINTYPTLLTGATTQRPYKPGFHYRNDVCENPYGPQFNWPWQGNSLLSTCGPSASQHFPSASLGGPWLLSYNNITDAELVRYIGWFAYQQGMLGGFTFVDPDDGTSYSNCRHATDVLLVTYAGPNSSSFDMGVVQYQHG